MSFKRKTHVRGVHAEIIVFARGCRHHRRIRKFERLRRPLQRKRHIKVELSVRLNVSRLFHAGHVVQNRRSALSLALQEWFSCKGKE